MSASAYIYIASGLLLLTVGAHALARGLGRLALYTGGSQRLAGLFVMLALVAPDTAVSLKAAWEGNGDLAVGNVIGSGIANLSLALGAIALLVPLSISPRTTRLDSPALILAAGLTWLLCHDGLVTAAEAYVLLATYAAYCVWLTMRHAPLLTALGRDAISAVSRSRRPALSIALETIATLAGLALLIVGTDAMERGAVEMARELGLSELAVGLTVIAAGTSLPVVLVCLITAAQGHREVAIQLLIASVIANSLLALGTAAALPGKALSVSPNALSFDLPVMLAACVASSLLFSSSLKVGRLKALCLLGYYGLYVLYLALFAAGIPHFDTYRHLLFAYVMPATALLLLAMLVWSLSRKALGKG
jgi:cation:H+ antiporter